MTEYMSEATPPLRDDYESGIILLHGIYRWDDFGPGTKVIYRAVTQISTARTRLLTFVDSVRTRGPDTTLHAFSLEGISQLSIGAPTLLIL